MPGFFMLLPPNGGNNANQPLGTLYRSISLISDFLNLTKFKKSKGDQKMSKKTYIVESYDPATRTYTVQWTWVYWQDAMV